MENHLKEKLTLLPSLPGVYLMKDSDDHVIYVGKAQNLKKRVTSYFRSPQQLDPKTAMLVKRLATFETIITATEKEALILESNLIKRHRPRYNVILKDDKRYPALRLDVQNPYPGLSIVRRIGSDGALYFGPFASAQAVRETVKIIERTFKLRKCKLREFKNRTRPCIYHQMGICMGPCSQQVDKVAYDENVRETILFLKGRTTELIKKIKNRMQQAAEHENYEKAAMLRDKMFALENILQKQVSVTTDLKDRDVLAVATSESVSVINLLMVRGGYLIGSRHFDLSGNLATESEMLSAFLRQFYDEARFIPGEILVSVLPEDAGLFEDWLGDMKGAKVIIRSPKRGDKVRLVQMAVQNAQNHLKDLVAQQASEIDLLQRLQARLRMDRLPQRIECIDNSNISGRQAVGVIVTFVDAKPQKSSYRKYRVKTVSIPDDYAYMAEVLTRRYGKPQESMPLPDLLLVDGGKGQLNVAVSVLKTLGIENRLGIAGIAEKDEKRGESTDKVYLPGRSNPVEFGREQDLLFFLQRIRDEAHRFAITFHRNRRRAEAMESVWDAIPGVGKERQKKLLDHFGSLEKIRAASLEELSRLPGISIRMARSIKSKLAD